MTELYESIDIRKTRKKHTCEICGRKIPKGFSARLHKGKYDGDFFRYYSCNTCTQLLSKYPLVCVDDDEGFVDGQLLYDFMSDYNCSTPLQLLNKLESGEIKY